MLALTTQAKINLTIKEKTSKGRQISAISEIHPTVPKRELLPVPGSDFGDNYSMEFKSLCLWPRKDGTCNGQLNGGHAFASGRMNPDFINDVLRNLGPDNLVTFRGIENNYRILNKRIKITNGVKINKELPELKIVEDEKPAEQQNQPEMFDLIPVEEGFKQVSDFKPAEQQNQPEMFDLIPVEEDFKPASDFKPANPLEVTTEVTEEELPGFIKDYFKPEPMPLKRKLPMPTSSPKRQQPLQPKIVNDSSAPVSEPRFQLSQALNPPLCGKLLKAPLAGVPADKKSLERHQPEVPELFSDWLE